MRLWSVHPSLLDRQALVACWREGLLAQSVIGKQSGGYSNHPQLVRFRECDDPMASLGAFLSAIVDEADARGYRFAREKIVGRGAVPPIPLAEGQLAYEWGHLLAKLRVRSPDRAAELDSRVLPPAHPVFTVVPGPIAPWERPLG
ncbi:pyrimidine dimer DNA glycosylase/endonuclease V [Homoserinimonas hongtaonis]|uniref:pyrimidine dimer DNA glycosylase/endonuclease V n=1 Tax=Homoserinimonas hongtaonis TaxID=2079791 RepID=UPI000D3D4D18|nr:pyrimidine dimer DNA glycosylase/endonuclease V [Salinibacterium hongtaonis]AWB90367.1 hypothetical protein C2138_13110 [Salinibacterium hongtaonis]